MRSSRSIMLLLAAALFLVAAACGCHIWRELHVRDMEQRTFEMLEDEVKKPEPDLPENEHQQNQSEEVIFHDCDTLISANADCIGWLTIPGTNVSYPVMWSPDEPERYLHRNFYGNYSDSGTPFLDARCDPESGNLVIYGHNMISGTMFGSLRQFLQKNYLFEHRDVFLEMQNGAHHFEIICVATVENNDPWYCFLQSTSPALLAETVSDLRERSRLKAGELPLNGERLLTLSTCTGWTRSSRLILVAKEI